MVPENKVFDPGKPDCIHRFVYHACLSSHRQVWTCDEPDCSRFECIDDLPGQTMRFPPHAYVRVANNTQLGGAEVYAFQANEEGKVQAPLSEEFRFPLAELEEKIKEVDKVYGR